MDEAQRRHLAEYTSATRVVAQVFNDRSKWKYKVHLDYSRTSAIVHEPSGYIDPVAAAVLALETATRNGTSEVTFESVHEGWVMFVQDPPGGWPIMVRGGLVGLGDRLLGDR